MSRFGFLKKTFLKKWKYLLFERENEGKGKKNFNPNRAENIKNIKKTFSDQFGLGNPE